MSDDEPEASSIGMGGLSERRAALHAAIDGTGERGAIE